MLWDSLIPRMREKGLTVYDVRGQLPRNGRWMGRAVSAVHGIAYHWDAEWRPHAYDSLARIISQANYHINKDWGGGSHGDGLMYHAQVDNVGDLYVTRDIEDVLWSVGDMNYSFMSICWHGTEGQDPTREQVESMQKISSVLCWETPEIPAGIADLKGHQEVPGNSTSCNGTFLPPTQWYRGEENTHPERYVYDWPDDPTPPVDNRPEWEKMDSPIAGGPKTMFINQDTTLFDITTGQALPNSYKLGDKIDNLANETSVGGQVYWRTKYSVDKGRWTGFKREHLSDQLVSPPVEPPVQPPVVPPTTDQKDEEQDKRLTAIEQFIQGLVSVLEAIGKAILEFVNKHKK